MECNANNLSMASIKSSANMASLPADISTHNEAHGTMVASPDQDAAGDAPNTASSLLSLPTKPPCGDFTNETEQPDGTRNAQNLDHGWAWLVMVSALFTHILTFGMSYATVGTFYVEFLTEFQQSNAATSWTGSIMLGMMLCSGPAISLFIDKCGACTVAVAGGAIASAGLFLSSMATSIIFLYFSFGVVTGLGLGMSYLPCIVMLGKFFERRRAFAAGIAASGSGLGTFIFAPFDQFLLATLGWRQSFIVLGCVELTLCLCGATYLESKIPVRSEGLEGREDNEERLNIASLPQTPSLVVIRQTAGVKPSVENLNSIRSALDAISARNTPVGSWKQSIGVKMRGSVFLQSPINSPLPSSPIPLDGFFGLASPINITRGASFNQSLDDSSSQVQPPVSGISVPTIEITHASTPPSSNLTSTYQASEGLGELTFGSWQQSVNARAVLSNFLQSPALSPIPDSPLTLDNISRLSVPSNQDLSLDRSTPESYNNITSTTLDPVLEESRLYPRLDDIVQQRCPTSVAGDDDSVKYDLDGEGQKSEEYPRRKRDSPLVTIYRLFHNRFFVLFSISGFVLCIGYQLPYMYFKAFALSLGIDEDSWAFIMACMGITDMLGRLIVGFIFDRAMCVSHRLVGYTLSLFLSGALLLLMSTASTYPTLAMAATSYTLIAGSTDPLVPALLVEYVGLDSLCYSFGFLIEMQGIGFLLGPPLAGIVYAYIGDYSAVFIVGALAFIVSGVIILLEPFCAQCQKWTRSSTSRSEIISANTTA
ncbi:uncharacterized protein [Asterias amurensis]|uniref:uncharacterized protein n=1 Tax=Asterias amurensis TaxID=7602 RepID=UPI003AB7CBC3